jgi:hypothetical protein
MHVSPAYKGSIFRVTGVEILPDTTKPRLSYVFLVMHVTDPTDLNNGPDPLNGSHLCCFLATGPPGWAIGLTTICGPPGLTGIKGLSRYT